MGQAAAAIVEPKSATGNSATPVGTGPYKLENWSKGSSVTLDEVGRLPRRREGQAQAGHVPVHLRPGRAGGRAAGGRRRRVPARVAAQRAAVQGRPEVPGDRVGSRARPSLAINNKKKPLDDVRVRRAIAAAIDRKAIIQAAGDGYGVPIGSHYVPGAFGYVDTTSVNPYNPEKAKALLKEAGVATPLELTLVLPPPPYARQGGEVIAGELAKVGINREGAERRMGAVAREHVAQRAQLRPDNHLACGTVRPLPLRRSGLLLGLPLGEIQRAL